MIWLGIRPKAPEPATRELSKWDCVAVGFIAGIMLTTVLVVSIWYFGR